MKTNISIDKVNILSKYKSKKQLVDEIVVEKNKFDFILSNLDEKQQCFVQVCEKWTSKDIICHLAKWQEMVLHWYKEGLQGKTPQVPHVKFKWSQLPELNNEIYLTYKDYSLKQATEFFLINESEIMKLVDTLDESILLNPGLYPWMNKNSLIAYIGSCTSSHYKWAYSLIRKKFK